MSVHFSVEKRTDTNFSALDEWNQFLAAVEKRTDTNFSADKEDNWCQFTFQRIIGVSSLFSGKKN